MRFARFVIFRYVVFQNLSISRARLGVAACDDVLQVRRKLSVKDDPSRLSSAFGLNMLL